MKKIILYLVCFLFLVLAFFAFKYYQLMNYSPKRIDISASNSFSVSNSVKSKNLFLEKMSYYLDDTEYISYDYGDTFVPIEDSINKTNVDIRKQITFDVEHNILKNISKLDSKIGTVEYISLMRKFKIASEMDLIQYYIDNQNIELSVLDSVSKMKIHYYSSIFADKLDLSGNISFFNGLDGYMVKKNAKTLVGIFYEGNLYQITFGSNYNDQFIKEFLNTISFME